MYCFDTNIIIDIFHGKKSIELKLNEIKESASDIFITPISLCELYKGAYLFFKPEEGVAQIDKFVSSLQILEFEQNACKEFGKTYAELKKKGKMTDEADLMIASIAKVNGLTMITRNKKHFENTGVKIEEW